MNAFIKFLAATFLSVAMLFTGVAQAISIPQFDKMGPAGDRYVADLVGAAERALTDAGRTDDEMRVRELFSTNAPDSKESIGMQQFYMTLARARVADANRAAQDPNAPRVRVENILALALDKIYGIKLPQEFFTLASALDPKYLSPTKEKKEKKN